MRRFALGLVLFVVSVRVLAQAPTPDAAVLDQLNEIRVDLQFDNAEFMNVIAALQEATRLNFMIDSKAKDAVQGSPVTLKLTKIRANQALRWLVAGRDLAWRVTDGVVVIGTKEESAGLAELRLYDVTDVASQPRDFPPAGAAPTQGVGVEDLVTLLKETIAPGTWDTPPNSLQAIGNQLVVCQTPQVLAQSNRLLSALGAQAHYTLTYDARVVDLAKDALAGAPNAGSLTPGKVLLSPAEVAGLLAKADGSVKVLEAARFTCMNGQRTHVRLGRIESSALGVVSSDPAAAGQVELRMDEQETLLEVSSILVAGRDQVLVDLRARLAEPGVEPETLSGSGVGVQCSRHAERRLHTSFQIPNGGGSLLVLGRTEDRLRALILRVISSSPALPISVAVEPEPAPEPEEAAFQAFLARTIDLSFSEQPLSEVVGKIRELSGINCLIDPVDLQEGAGDLKVTIQLKGLTAKISLQLLTKMLDLTFVYRDGVIVFTREQRAEAPRVEVYDVRDLLWHRLDWPAPPLSWESQVAASHLMPETEEVTSLGADQLAELIHSNIAPASWDEYGDQVRMTFFAGALVVAQIPSAHRQIRAFLEQLRSAKPKQVQIDARVIELSDALHDSLDAGGGGALPEASRAALEKAIADGKATVTAAWSLLGMNAERFHAARWLRRGYVLSYEDAKGLDPVYDTVVGGTLIDVRPTQMTTDPGKLLVELHAVCCDLPDVFPQSQVGLVTFLFPQESRGEVSTTVATRSGETRLFTLGGPKVEVRRVLVWTVRTVE